ncbi:uncharacterized protein FOMMEDRAFT_155592 [Fomitiporia mediterranea MF3/22]|uniref:uncharacterized protein n=1 Tax=Fomitiporia mediterranea (strain MF3/22) TaxID=694068 RepID=UPI00044076C5|nr:uncharacterized protein FOMMEDRAFT_155592 [Fomitiporia mediterranea MF3/22]EJD04461.1 hypothetical protein FOMMEDRAFT_155592 [Fomitiporia mediterranea MF3/22]
MATCYCDTRPMCCGQTARVFEAENEENEKSEASAVFHGQGQGPNANQVDPCLPSSSQNFPYIESDAEGSIVHYGALIPDLLQEAAAVNWCITDHCQKHAFLLFRHSEHLRTLASFLDISLTIRSIILPSSSHTFITARRFQHVMARNVFPTRMLVTSKPLVCRSAPMPP